jgi:hypothetical protein
MGSYECGAGKLSPVPRTYRLANILDIDLQPLASEMGLFNITDETFDDCNRIGRGCLPAIQQTGSISLTCGFSNC